MKADNCTRDCVLAVSVILDQYYPETANGENPLGDQLMMELDKIISLALKSYEEGLK